MHRGTQDQIKDRIKKSYSIFRHAVAIRELLVFLCGYLFCFASNLCLFPVFGLLSYFNKIGNGNLSEILLKFSVSSLVLTIVVYTSSFLRRKVKWSGGPFEMNKFSVDFFIFLVSSFFLGGLAGVVKILTYPSLPLSFSHLCLSLAFQSGCLLFQNFDKPNMKKKISAMLQNDNPQCRKELISCLIPSHSQLIRSMYFPKLYIYCNIPLKLIFYILLIINGKGKSFDFSIAADAVVLLCCVYLFLLNFVVDQLLRLALDEPVDFLILASEPQHDGHVLMLEAADLLEAACFIGREIFSVESNISPPSDFFRRTNIAGNAMKEWNHDLEKKLHHFNDKIFQTVEYHFSGGGIPCIDSCSALPLWAVMIRRNAFKDLATNITESKSHNFRALLYKTKGDRIIQSCCVAINLLNFQMLTMAFGIDPSLTNTIIFGARDPPAVNVYHLAEKIILESYFTSTVQLKFKWIEKVITDHIRRIQTVQRFKLNLSHSYIEEASLAAEASSKLAVRSMRESPYSIIQEHIPYLIYCLAGAMVSMKALKLARSRKGLIQGYIPPESDVRLLDHLHTVYSNCLLNLVDLYGKEIERVRFPTSYAEVIQECFKST